MPGRDAVQRLLCRECGSEQQQIESGILPEMIRVSVGIEDINDIMNDFDKALRAVTK